jgi:hypothetical protein
MKSGIELIAEERKRQVTQEGFTNKSDDVYVNGELSAAASAYAHPVYFEHSGGTAPIQWQWNPKSWKPSPNNRVKELIKAGALIVAEIDRIQRKNNENSK